MCTDDTDGDAVESKKWARSVEWRRSRSEDRGVWVVICYEIHTVRLNLLAKEFFGPCK